jgi:hypothetical protein
LKNEVEGGEGGDLVFIGVLGEKKLKAGFLSEIIILALGTPYNSFYF